MDETFSITQYLADSGNDLVTEFVKAGRATQSVAIGMPAKNQPN
jgi:hypothetical protein